MPPEWYCVVHMLHKSLHTCLVGPSKSTQCIGVYSTCECIMLIDKLLCEHKFGFFEAICGAMDRGLQALPALHDTQRVSHSLAHVYYQAQQLISVIIGFW